MAEKSKIEQAIDDEKLVIFGWITTILGIPTKDELAQYNRLTDKMHEMMVGHVNLVLLRMPEERVKALIRLEQWAKLHNLDAEQILDGIEHMAISELQMPYQRHVNYPQRLEELRKQAEK